MSTKLKIGLFGFGCVGSGLYAVLNQSNLLNATIAKIVVKNPSKKRTLPADQFGYDPNSILEDPSINLVVELIDDAEAAYQLVTKAIKKGKHVVTANKKLIAEHLDELLVLKDEYGVSLLYEAAVCGSIPIIRNLEEYYNNDSLAGIQGICNGTSNYILTRLNNELKQFDEILKDAQDAGFAESDPTLDIDGFDSKYKLQLLILHTFGLKTIPSDILNLGIRHIGSQDVLYAKEKGLKIRLLSFAQKVNDQVVAYVAPVFVKEEHFAHAVDFEFNAVSIEALFSDRQVFKGKGAGSFPTASAVLSDISALQYDYKYEYKKLASATSRLAEDFELSVFISSQDNSTLCKVPLIRIDEEFTSSQYAYKVGRIRISELNHSFYRNNPELFIAILEDAPIKILEKKTLFTESYINH